MDGTIKKTVTDLARRTLETYITEQRIPKVGEFALPSEMLTKRAGAFVSIHMKNGDLRGCIGTISPVTENIATEIIQNAISAGTGDPRFFPVKERELKELVYSVDILGIPEKIMSKEELDVKRYGVIVRKGRRTGLLLPNLEGVNTKEEQIAIALRKAGIGPGEDYDLERFEVVRYEE